MPERIGISDQYSLAICTSLSAVSWLGTGDRKDRLEKKKKGLKNLKEITENVERKERAVKIFPLKFSIPGIGNTTVNSIVLERSSRFRYRLRPDCGDQWHTGEVREEIKRQRKYKGYALCSGDDSTLIFHPLDSKSKWKGHHPLSAVTAGSSNE
ncbi:hypothetical protein TNIN_414541 [Trichonephila inaurata madagascariensis]|uniref:Uncharacterized protein n=1 Tax=Trichonephila inaurata madagascariensis TaxID=2747483 RepID=A0A8X6YWF7_9ARAC|nr:hypothetical protein TNIN_414541 [Trichonephila inaurata madagascariensis]